MTPYLELCESWWQSWLAGTSSATAEIRARYDLDAAPEPYIPFRPGENPLVVLTTNPGATMPHQRRDRIMAGQSVLTPSMDYAQAAEVLSRFYTANLTGAAAVRIAAQRDLARQAGYTGVFQVECCPWHSPKSPGKDEIVRLLAADEALSEYTQALSDFMAPRPVVVISAISSRADLSSPDLPLSPWLHWQRDLIGLRQSAAEMIPLVWKDERITSSALVDRTGSALKVLLLMQGGNHLPGPRGRAILEGRLRKAAVDLAAVAAVQPLAARHRIGFAWTPGAPDHSTCATQHRREGINGIPPPKPVCLRRPARGLAHSPAVGAPLRTFDPATTLFR